MRSLPSLRRGMLPQPRSCLDRNRLQALAMTLCCDSACRCADALVLTLLQMTSKCNCRLGVLQVHRFACKGGLLSQETTDCLAMPQQPPAAPVEASEAQAPATPPAPEPSTCMPASSELVSDAAPHQRTVATAVQAGPEDLMDGTQVDGLQAQNRSASIVGPVAAKPVTWFVPACN